MAIKGEQEHGMTTLDVCPRHGVSSATFDMWKTRFGGMDMGCPSVQNA